MPYSPLENRWLAGWIAGSTFANIVGGGAAAALVIAGHAGGAGESTLASIGIGAIAGVVAGAVIGRLQAALLPPTVSRRNWLVATVGGTVVVWTLVALVPTLVVGRGGDGSMVARIALAMNVGAAAGMLFGAFQAPVLASLAVRTRPWLLGTSAGWGTGASITYVATGAPSSSLDALVAAFVLSGIGGLASGVTTALALRLEARRAQLMGQSAGRTCATELV